MRKWYWRLWKRRETKANQTKTKKCPCRDQNSGSIVAFCIHKKNNIIRTSWNSHSGKVHSLTVGTGKIMLRCQQNAYLSCLESSWSMLAENPKLEVLAISARLHLYLFFFFGRVRDTVVVKVLFSIFLSSSSSCGLQRVWCPCTRTDRVLGNTRSHCPRSTWTDTFGRNFIWFNDITKQFLLRKKKN